MKPYVVEVSAIVKAEPAKVYQTIADYHEGHPRILPPKYFLSLKVDEGGVGEGTKISFQMRVLGTTRNFNAIVTEPEPGRVLAETNLEGGAVSTFYVDPVNDGKHARVTICTKGQTERDGLLGSVERVLGSSFLRRVYKEELILLEAAAQERSA